MKAYILMFTIYFLKKKSLVLICLLLGLSARAFAQVEDQTPAIGAYSLPECIRYAFEYRESLKKQDMEIRIAGAEVKERISVGLPQIRANAGLTHNYLIQKTIIPDGSLFGGEPGPLAVEFQPAYSGSASITLEQLLFDASYFIGLRGAEMYRDLIKKQLNQAKVDVAESVSKAYYGVLINDERLKLLDQNLARLDTILKETKALYQNGFVELIDVKRIEVSYNNLKVEKTKTLVLQDFSKRLLKYQMGMPLGDSLALTDKLTDLENSLLPVLEVQSDHTTRIEYDILEYQKELSKINFKYNRSVYYPKLEGFVTYGGNTGTQTLGDFFRFSQRWFSFGAIGLNLSIPILDGLKRSNTLQKYRLNVYKAEEDLKIYKRSYQISVEQYRLALQNALVDMQTQKQNMELAAEVSRLAKIKYAGGIGSNLEIVNAETAFKEAESNYFSAVYDAAISKVDLEKALGVLIKKNE